MSFGLSVVTAKGYAKQEIITDRLNGFLIDEKEDIDYNKTEARAIDQIVNYCSFLILHEEIRSAFSRNNIQEIKEGMFSKSNMNAQINRIYNEAI